MADLVAVHEKMRRADEHFGALADEVLAYLKTTQSTFTPKFKRQPPQILLQYTIVPKPPIRLSVIVGDCVYNTRSALDQLICCIVQTAKPTAKCRDTYFPICIDAERYKDERAEMLKWGIPKQAITIIDTLQPCSRLDGTALIHPLVTLNKLSNRDKHRSPILTAAYTQHTFVTIGEGDQARRMKLPRALKDGASVLLMNLPDTAKPGVKVKIDGTAVITFKDLGPWESRTFDEVLYPTIQYVKQFVVPRLKPFVH